MANTTRRVSPTNLRSSAHEEEDSVENLAVKLRRLRDHVGTPSFDTLATEMRDDVRWAPNGEVFRRIHKGDFTFERIDLDVVAWLSTYYNIPLEDLSVWIADRYDATQRIADKIRTRWRASVVANLPFQQTVLSLDFGDFHAAPVVVCRCGQTHELRDDSAPCVYCEVPTFDEHRVCARCRDLETLEAHAGDVIDLVELASQTA